MNVSSMMTEGKVGITVEPWHELIVLVCTNAEGGLVPIPLTIEETEELAALLVMQATKSREAFQ